MLGTVTLPVWLFLLILLFASVTAASHFFIPPVRWFLRRRLERAVTRLNTRLDRPIQPFKLLRRQDMILRLSYDPAVLKAIAQHARENDIREDVAHAHARRYAREIVPSFSAVAYFGFAIRAARWLSTRLYDVRLVYNDDGAIKVIDRDATVVFVMNHRSNMDYVLVTYLAAERSALAYAVGEWARVWPVSRLLRAMGAYFIRRRSRNALYRLVLARYVQMSVGGGVTQAIFPEGGLSLDGRVAPPKLGLLSYIVEGFDPEGRDVVFVPVALNYDRVIEDNILVEARRRGDRRFRGSFVTGTVFVLRWVYRRLRGRVRLFGLASVSFGRPISLRERRLGGALNVRSLALELMARIRRDTPILPAPLVCAALLDGAATRPEIVRWIDARLPTLKRNGHTVHLSDGDTGTTVDRMVEMLRLRHIVEERDDRILPTSRAPRLLSFYAASVCGVDAAVQDGAGCTPIDET